MTDATLVTLWWCAWLFVSWCIGWHDWALMLVRRRLLGPPPSRRERLLWAMVDMVESVEEAMRKPK